MRPRVRWTMPLLVRADALRNAGVSYSNIARVLKLDYGIETTGESVAAGLKLHMGHQPVEAKRRSNTSGPGRAVRLERTMS